MSSLELLQIYLTSQLSFAQLSPAQLGSAPLSSTYLPASSYQPLPISPRQELSGSGGWAIFEVAGLDVRCARVLCSCTCTRRSRSTRSRPRHLLCSYARPWAHSPAADALVPLGCHRSNLQSLCSSTGRSDTVGGKNDRASADNPRLPYRNRTNK